MVGGLLAAVIAVAVIAPLVLDINDYKGNLAELVKQQTGREFAIDGDIEFSLLPIPTVKLGGVRFANLAGAASPDMVRIATVEASIALAPLFSGRVEVDSLTFIDPVIELEALADGRVNWQLDLAGGDTGDSGGDSPWAVSIDVLRVENATLIYRDSASGRVERIDKLDLEAAMDSLIGPYRATGRLVARTGGGEPLGLSFELDIDRLDRRPLPLRAVVRLASADASIGFTGTASSAAADAELSGKLKLEGASLARILEALGGAPSGALLDQAFSASATVSATQAAAGINDIRFDFGGIQGTGAVSATLAQGPQIDVAIALNRVDLDALMARAAETDGEPAAAPAAAGAFALPDGIYATLDLRIDALVFNRAVVRQAQIVAALDQGVLTLQQASALLPGGSDITLFGVLDSHNDKPRFTGQVEASSDNLRAVLDWLAIAYPEVPADRLRKLSLSSKIELTPNLAKISAIDLRLDLSRLSGGVNVGIGTRPAFNAIVAIDKINLDAYLPAEQDETGEAVEAGAAEDSGNPFALLDTFDAEFKLKIGSLIYKTAPISGISLDAGVRGGVLTLRRLAIGNLEGASGTLAGVLDSAKPGFDMTYDMESDNASRLFKLAGITPPSTDLGALTVQGRVSGDLESVTLDTRMTLPGAEAQFKGAVTGLAGTAAIDAEISLATDNLSAFARRFGAVLPSKADGPFSLNGTVKGDVAAAVVDLTLAALSGEIRVDGALENLLASPRIDLALTASHPDFVALAESLADGVRFEIRDLGEVRLRARVTGDLDALRIEGIDALLGPSQIAGTISARFDGAKPAFEADLTAGEFVADMFLAAIAGGGGTAGSAADGAGGGSAERWSRDTIDLSGMHGFDLNLRLTSKALSLRKYRFEDVTLRLALADGVLDVEELSGRLYGAATQLRARLAATTPLTLGVSFSLEGADMRALMIDAADLDAISGRLNLAGQFDSRGRSEFELISALQGEATLAVRDGVIEGIDLGQLNNRLANIDSGVDLIALIGGALSGGATAIHSLDGRLVASGGVLRSDDLRAVLEGGEGRATLSVDLPRWQLAMNSEFRLSGHPKAPPVGLLLMGPIDNPEREIRDQALREYIAAKVVSVGVRQLLPAITGQDAVGGILGGALLNALTGGGGEPAPAQQDAQPAEQPPPAEPAPQKLFQNLLEGLIQGIEN
jgi:uncharacterized protein involved in outer membrane biogenesis